MSLRAIPAHAIVLLIAVVLAIGTIAAAQSSCDNRLEQGNGRCAGFEKFAYENGSTATVLVIALALVAGAAMSRRRTRPCPRCGERVEVGSLDCPHCSFDFRTIG